MTRPMEWIALADGQGARLCRGSIAAGGRWYFEEATSIVPGQDRIERGRPTALGRPAGRGGSALPRSGAVSGRARALGRPAGRGGYALAERRREVMEETKRFARDVAGWLGEHVELKQIECVHVFAPPRFLGHLRAVMPDSLRSRVVEHKEDLSHLTAGQLARHAAIEAIVSRHAGGRATTG